ncbi:PREDICTED: uncharacterized protein LOC109584016 isoform X2 [Amphimedon queenslandica]|uniref:IgGFc-binding protein N-terminal domain-containing protein n=1 Tax=Amphimedon queenslandica TaxID=400682 RepID=A0AAN0JEE7_AMPQE|nr:PREDICTED: uncharacterized protein LOC109584016 isoform X2 [Amphimedon queenslandica]|eukprot:XP_019855137.1 PREDICTED: uncharacterized protein LOC109584016 isoform X2 [Amphimedon queenslandica]
MILLLLFLLFISAGSSKNCDRFMDLSLVSHNAQNIKSTTNVEINPMRRQRALLEYEFNCSSTTITSLLLGIDVHTATNTRSLYPSVNVYRRSGNYYNAMSGSTRHIYYSTSNVSTSGVFEYQLIPPLSIINGDLLAVSQPSSDYSAVTINYLARSGISFMSSQEMALSSTQFSSSVSDATDKFILVHPITDGYCVRSSNSITASVVRENIFKIRRPQQMFYGYQYLYPDMIFSCNGTINKWIFGAIRRSGFRPLEFQIWHQIGPRSYIKTRFSSVTTGTKIGTNLYEYIPRNPLVFHENEMFGVYVPQFYLSVSVLYEQHLSGPVNLRVQTNQPLSTRNTAFSTVLYNDFPLVTVEYGTITRSSHSFTSSIKTSDATSHLIATSSHMKSSDTSITNSAFEYTILPTSTASVTQATFNSIITGSPIPSPTTLSTTAIQVYTSSLNIIDPISKSSSSIPVSSMASKSHSSSMALTTTPASSGLNFSTMILPLSISVGTIIVVLILVLGLLITAVACFFKRKNKNKTVKEATVKDIEDDTYATVDTIYQETCYTDIEEIYDEINEINFKGISAT